MERDDSQKMIRKQMLSAWKHARNDLSEKEN